MDLAGRGVLSPPMDLVFLPAQLDLVDHWDRNRLDHPSDLEDPVAPEDQAFLGLPWGLKVQVALVAPQDHLGHAAHAGPEGPETHVHQRPPVAQVVPSQSSFAQSR